MKALDVVVIGAGNVATHFSLALYNAGYNLIQVYSRSISSAKILAELVNASYTIDILEIQKADLYIYSVSDSALPLLVENMLQTDGIHVHTTGSVEMAVFGSKFKEFGVLYPLQTFSKEKQIDFRKVPLFIEASSGVVLAKLQLVASSISDVYNVADSTQRIKLHIAAVFACNFGNYFYTIASLLLQKEGLSFDLLKPLIRETYQKIETMHPFDAQTGPARRNDQITIQKHCEMLEDLNLKDLYVEISKQISDLYGW